MSTAGGLRGEPLPGVQQRAGDGADGGAAALEDRGAGDLAGGPGDGGHGVAVHLAETGGAGGAEHRARGPVGGEARLACAAVAADGAGELDGGPPPGDLAVGAVELGPLGAGDGKDLLAAQ